KSFPQDQFVQRQLRYRLLQPFVLAFEILQPLGLVELQAAVLPAPPVIVNGTVNLTHPCRYRQLGTDPPVAIAVVPARGNNGSQTFSSSVVVLPAAAVGRAMTPARRLSFRR